MLHLLINSLKPSHSTTSTSKLLPPPSLSARSFASLRYPQSNAGRYDELPLVGRILRSGRDLVRADAGKARKGIVSREVGGCMRCTSPGPRDSPILSFKLLFAALILFLEWLTFFLGTALRIPSHCSGSSSSSAALNDDEPSAARPAGSSDGTESLESADSSFCACADRRGKRGRVKSKRTSCDATLRTTDRDEVDQCLAVGASLRALVLAYDDALSCRDAPRSPLPKSDDMAGRGIVYGRQEDDDDDERWLVVARAIFRRAEREERAKTTWDWPTQQAR